MRHSVGLLGAFVLFLFLSAGAVRSQEAVPPDKIPKAVMDALLAKFPKAKIDKCTKAKESDDIVYDIEFKQEGRKCEADIKQNGTYINYEKDSRSSRSPARRQWPTIRPLSNKELWHRRALLGGSDLGRLGRFGVRFDRHAVRHQRGVPPRA